VQSSSGRKVITAQFFVGRFLALIPFDPNSGDYAAQVSDTGVQGDLAWDKTT
jgi:hypothetical protein